MALTVTKTEFDRMDDSAVRTYLSKVYSLYQQLQRGCCTCNSDSIDISLHSVVAFTQWTQEQEFTGEGSFNVLSTHDLLATFDNSNSI